MSYNGGLPYDATPPPDDIPPQAGPSKLDKPLDDPLDKPLDDYKPPKSLPPHVSDLMGRMSHGKVYLLEESPGIIHVDAPKRLEKDPVGLCVSLSLMPGHVSVRAEMAENSGTGSSTR